MIESFGPDPGDSTRPIDHGSVVRKGDVLAQIDPTVYQAQVDYAKASLARAEADLLQLKAKRDQAKNEWLRAQSLLPEKAISDTDYDMIASNYHVATANVEVGRAAIQQCEAQLRIAETYLGYTVIKSPIDGVVIDRRVNVGQTVIAAFNAPGLFVIAKDLRRVQVWASVKEMDIGYIRPGMPVQFDVAAYPGETFAGQVTEVLLNPTKGQDCATYTVVVATSNSHGMLPYLTAKLHFQIDRRCRAEPTCDIALQRGPRSAPASPAVRAAAPTALAGQAAYKRPLTVPGRAVLPKASNQGKKPSPKVAGQA
jgi:HlyD family secretion protein